MSNPVLQHVRTAFIGRNTNTGERVFAEIRLCASSTEQESIEHEVLPVGSPLLRVSASVVGKGRRSVSGAGQIKNAIRGEDIAPAVGWSQHDIDELMTLWDEAHLSDMHAECAHMQLPTSPTYEDRAHLVCPITGYQYGRRVLAKALTEEQVAKAQRLMSLPQGKIPDYV